MPCTSAHQPLPCVAHAPGSDPSRRRSRRTRCCSACAATLVGAGHSIPPPVWPGSRLDAVTPGRSAESPAAWRGWGLQWSLRTVSRGGTGGGGWGSCLPGFACRPRPCPAHPHRARTSALDPRALHPRPRIAHAAHLQPGARRLPHRVGRRRNPTSAAGHLVDGNALPFQALRPLQAGTSVAAA